MKAISILQPWATLMVIGAKKIETRSWYTSHRGPLAIHASLGDAWLHKLFSREPFYRHLREAGYTNADALPRGAIIGEVHITDCRRIVTRETPLTKMIDKRVLIHPPTGDELAFGDFTPGRYAWMSERAHLYPWPIPAKGQLSLWEREIPNHYRKKICDMCGEPFTGKGWPVFNENYRLQEGLIQCEHCHNTKE